MSSPSSADKRPLEPLLTQSAPPANLSDTVPATWGCQLTRGPRGCLMAVAGALGTPWTPLALVPRQPRGATGSPNCSLTGTEAQEGYLLMGHPAGECSTSQPSYHRTWKTVLLSMKCPVVRKTIRNVAVLMAPKHTPQTHAQGPRNNPANPLPLSNPEVQRASAMGPQRAISSVSEMRTQDQR